MEVSEYRAKYNLRYLSDQRVQFHAPVVAEAEREYREAAQRLDRTEQQIGGFRYEWPADAKAVYQIYLKCQNEAFARREAMMKEEMDAETDAMMNGTYRDGSWAD